MSRALAAFVLGVLAALSAIGFAMYYGLLPRGIQVLGAGTGATTSASGSSASAAGSATTSTSISSTSSSTSSGGASSDVVGSVLSYLLSVIGSYVDRSRSAVTGFFSWLLGSSLADAVANLVVLIIVAGIVYWLLKFFKWIVAVVVLIDAVLIVLKYVLMVI